MSIDICILWTTLCVGARMKRRRAQAGHNEVSRSLTSDITQITQKTCPPSRRRSGKRDVTPNLSGQVHPNVTDEWKPEHKARTRRHCPSTIEKLLASRTIRVLRTGSRCPEVNARGHGPDRALWTQDGPSGRCRSRTRCRLYRPEPRRTGGLRAPTTPMLAYTLPCPASRCRAAIPRDCMSL